MRNILFLLIKALILISPAVGCAKTTFQKVAELTPTIPMPPSGVFQDSYGQILHYQSDDKILFVGAIVARPDPAKSAEGAVYVYRNQHDEWILDQTITTSGFSDHFSAITIKSFGRWLFISAIGTPIGPFPGDAADTQDFTGSIQIYRRENDRGDKLGTYKFVQAIDRTTPGLEDLTVVDPADLIAPPPPAPSVEHGAAFGLSFDMTDDHKYLLVGAATQQITVNDEPLINAGKVFSFKNKNDRWELVQTLENPEGSVINGTFGGIVKISNDYALISNAAVFTDGKVGAKSYVYLYHLENGKWKFVQKIQSDQEDGLSVTSATFGGNVEMWDQFGASMDFDGKWAIVGAPLAHLDTNGIKGAAYLYKLEEVNKVKKLVFKKKIVTDVSPSSGDYANSFLTGMSVALYDKTALIADPTHVGPSGEIAQGAILVYDRNNDDWSHTTTLFDPEGSNYELFSNGLALNNKYIFGGTGTAVATLYLAFFFDPAFLPIPLPLQTNKVIIWKR